MLILPRLLETSWYRTEGELVEDAEVSRGPSGKTESLSQLWWWRWNSELRKRFQRRKRWRERKTRMTLPACAGRRG